MTITDVDPAAAATEAVVFSTAGKDDDSAGLISAIFSSWPEMALL